MLWFIELVRIHDRNLPRSPGGREGRSPRRGFRGDPFAVERASARRGVGRQPHVALMKQGIGLPFALVRDGVLSGSGCMIRFKFPCGWGKGWDAAILFRTSAFLAGMQTWIRSHPKVAVLARHRSHPKSSKLFHIHGKIVSCREITRPLSSPRYAVARSHVGVSKARAEAPRVSGRWRQRLSFLLLLLRARRAPARGGAGHYPARPEARCSKTRARPRSRSLTIA